MASRPYSFGDKLGLALLAIVLALVVWNLSSGAREVPVPPGTPMPPLEAVGWLNLAEGKSFDPGGKVVVVDCWATWCGPCRAEMPRLALAAAHYRPLGVEFLGVTQEGKADVPQIEEFIAETPGFDWPVAYGAGDFFDALKVQYIPTVIVFGADGRAIWSGIGSEGIEAALDAALAAKG